tara:strand:- start:582 stop:956 length:375 start_codon:yes stop_codon:yes gene_type:complete
MNNENKQKYNSSVNKLLENIKVNYADWGSNPNDLEDSQKKTRLRMIDEFNNGLHIRSGIKFDKVVTGSSVWGFIAKTDGVLKGIPYFVGDVFKAAGWKAPAKHVRGTIFSSETNWFSWTGPRYL